MNWDEIWKIVLCILTSIGGIGGIILAIIKFSSDIIAKRLEEKYKLTLNKELEKYKSNLDNKTYISKTKFDTEFSIYKELSKVFSEMVKNISLMIPSGMSIKLVNEDAEKESKNKLYDSALSSAVVAQDVLNQYIPFIPSNIFDDYNKILVLSRLQLSAFQRRWNLSYVAPQKEKENFSDEEYIRTGEISEKFKMLNNNIREYLSTLDVLD